MEHPYLRNIVCSASRVATILRRRSLLLILFCPSVALSCGSHTRVMHVRMALTPAGALLHAGIAQVATEAAQQGAAVIRQKTGAEVIKTKGNPRDLLTEVDSEVQSIIEGAVTAAFPDHGFLVRWAHPQILKMTTGRIAYLTTPMPVCCVARELVGEQSCKEQFLVDEL